MDYWKYSIDPNIAEDRERENLGFSKQGINKEKYIYYTG